MSGTQWVLHHFFWDTHHLVPDIAHAPAVPQKMGASKKTGCDTHWVPDIWHPVARVHLFFGFKMCVSQKNGVTPIGCQTLAMHLCVPKKRVHQKKLGVTPIGYQTSAPSGARAPVFLVLKCVYPKKKQCDTHWVPDIGTQWRACTCVSPRKGCIKKNWVGHPLGTRHWFQNVSIPKKLV